MQREAAMISYQWYLSPDQPFNKKELFKLQYCLYAAGIYLDLSWKDGSPVMTISVPEQAPEDKSGLITEESISSSDSGPCVYCIIKIPKVADKNGESCISILEKIA